MKKVIEQLQELAEELNGNTPINWCDDEQVKYQILYHPTQKKLKMVWDGYKSFETTPYCHHSSYLTLAKQRIGEDKLLSLFGVKKEIKRGQLCEFWNEGKDYTVIGKFYGYLDNRFSDRVGSYYDYCKPLTKEEIQEYLDLAED